MKVLHSSYSRNILLNKWLKTTKLFDFHLISYSKNGVSKKKLYFNIKKKINLKGLELLAPRRKQSVLQNWIRYGALVLDGFKGFDGTNVRRVPYGCTVFQMRTNEGCIECFELFRCPVLSINRLFYAIFKYQIVLI